MTTRANGEAEYVSPQILFIEFHVEHGFAGSISLDNSNVELDGFDINNPDGQFSMDE